MSTAAPNPTGTLDSLWSVLRDNPDYRRLYFARAASLLGDWFNLLAVLALLRHLGAGGAGAVGTVVILKLLPVTLAGPAAGVVADRFSRKTILLVADASRFFLVLGMFAAPWLSGGGRFLIYLLTALQITAQAFSEPARVATIPNVVPARQLGAANALGALTWSLMFTLGAAAGGVATSLLGWRIALGVDAASYLVSLAFLWRARVPHPRPETLPCDLWTYLGVRDFLAVGRYLALHPRVLSFMTAKTGWGLAAGALSMMLALYGERVYPLRGSVDLGIAVVYMARGLGTAIGPVASRRVAGERPFALRVAIGVAFVLSAVCYAFFAGVSSLPLALLLLVVAHIGGSTVWVFSTLLLQREVPDGFRGRVFAAELGLATAAIAATTWGWGWLLDSGRVSLRGMTVTIAVCMALAGVAWMAIQLGVRSRERKKTPRMGAEPVSIPARDRR